MALNGRFPDSLLAYLGWPEMDHLRLVPAAAASITRLAAAFEATFSRPLYVSDAYRTYAQQVSLKITKGVYAATAGTSVHGLGLAVDLASRINVDGSAEHRWMEANGPQFGWINPAWAVDYNPANGQHEPWHWEYRPSLDTHPTPAPAQEDDMPLTDTDITRIREECVYNMWRQAEIAQIIGTAVWDHRLAKGAETPVAAKAWLVDTRIIVGTLPAAIIAALPATAAGVGISLEQVEAAVKLALGTLTLKSV